MAKTQAQRALGENDAIHLSDVSRGEAGIRHVAALAAATPRRRSPQSDALYQQTGSPITQKPGECERRVDSQLAPLNVPLRRFSWTQVSPVAVFTSA